MTRARASRRILIGWTLFLWASRLRMVLVNDELDGWGLAVRATVVAVFVGLAVLVGLRATPTTLALLVWWTIGYWLVRGGAIMVGSEDATFKLVHAALMVVSLATAVWAWAARPRSGAARPRAGA